MKALGPGDGVSKGGEEVGGGGSGAARNMFYNDFKAFISKAPYHPIQETVKTVIRQLILIHHCHHYHHHHHYDHHHHTIVKLQN